jgi:hypothetical protein
VTNERASNPNFNFVEPIVKNPFRYRQSDPGLWLWELNLSEERVREVVRKFLPVPIADALFRALLDALALVVFAGAVAAGLALALSV